MFDPLRRWDGRRDDIAAAIAITLISLQERRDCIDARGMATERSGIANVKRVARITLPPVMSHRAGAILWLVWLMHGIICLAHDNGMLVLIATMRLLTMDCLRIIDITRVLLGNISLFPMTRLRL